jgi:(2Fe-2S) ferredoxin
MKEEARFRIYLCGGPHCTASGRSAILKALEDELWAWQLDSSVDVRVSGCQDRCDDAPNMTVWPGPYHYANLTPELVARIVEQHLLHEQPLHEHLQPRRTRR